MERRTILYETRSGLPDQVVRCGDCGEIIFEIRDGNIHHLGKHRGDWHENTIQILPLVHIRMTHNE